jgi:PAS domain S-box-containing protein
VWRAYTGQEEPLPTSGWLDGVVHPDDRAATTLAWEQAVRTGEPLSITHRLRGADGRYRTFLTQASPVLDDERTVTRLQGVSCDLSEWEREDGLTALQAQAFAATRDAVILTDGNGCITDWNLAAEVLFGYTRAEAVGRTLAFLYGAKDGERREGDILSAVLRDGVWSGESTYVRADGTSSTCETTVRRVVDAQGEVIGAISVNRDVTARAPDEARLELLLETERATRRDLDAALASAQAAEAKLHTLIDRNTSGVFIADADSLIEANDAFLRTFGYTREDVEARRIRWLELTPPGWTAQDDRASQELITQGACTPYEKEYLHRDGTPIPIILSGVLLEWQPLRIMGFVMDISARKRLEREMEARAAELETVLDTMAEAVFVYDAKGELRRTNTAARTLNPATAAVEYRAEPFGKRFDPFDVRDAAGRPLAADKVPAARALRGERFTSNDIRMRVGGRDLLLNTSGAPIRNERGAVTGAVTVTRDVTEQRALEQRTHRALDSLLRLAGELVQEPGEGAGDVARRLAELTCEVIGCRRVGILVTTREDDVLAPFAVAGLSPEQEQQWWAEQRATQARVADVERRQPEFVARMRAGEVQAFVPTRPPYNEQPNPYNIHNLIIAPLLASNQLIGMLALDHGEQPHIYTDEEQLLAGAVAKLVALVVERERLLEDRARAQARVLALEDANARMDTFLGVASHELRTPLTSIKANVQITDLALQGFLRAHPNDDTRLERAANLIHRTDKHIDRLDRLVEDLLDVSRIQAGTLALEIERCDLVGVVREAVEEQLLAWPRRQIALALALDEAWVDADADRIGQVVTNYLTNALKYSEETEPVEVEVRQEGAQAWVGVRDQGPGLGPEEQERIWERFHRVEGVEVLNGSGVGLGLGLYICKTIVERHGGQVGVESAPGQGAVFWFTLPLASA